MKLIIVLCVTLSGVLSALGQGQIYFNNRGGVSFIPAPGQVMAPVYLPDPGSLFLEKHGNTSAGVPPGTQVYYGDLLEGTGYTAELWGGPAGCSESQLQALAQTTFRMNAVDGAVQPPIPAPTVPGVPAGGMATFQLRVWANLGGAVTSWAQVQGNDLVLRGKSTQFTVPFPLGGGSIIPPFLQGLLSFNLHRPVANSPPQIVTQPQDLTLDPGGDATLSVAAFGTDPLVYRWQFNGQDVPSQTNWSWRLSNVQPTSGGHYRVVVANGAGAVTSAVATLTVQGPPVVVRQPQSFTRAAGASVVFEVVTTGTAPLSHRWLHNLALVMDGGRVSGATTPSMTIANIQAADAGDYRAVASNFQGSIFSAAAELNVLVPDIPGYPGVLTVTHTGGDYVLTWTMPEVVLQHANSLAGPWTDVAPPALSPFAVPIIDASRFYRVRPK